MVTKITPDATITLRIVRTRYQMDDANYAEFVAACETMAEIRGRVRIKPCDVRAALGLTLNLRDLVISEPAVREEQTG